MILSRILMILLVMAGSVSAQADNCMHIDDFQLVESPTQWENNEIEAKTYVKRKVNSKIGTFRLLVTGGIFEWQLAKTKTYVCSPEPGSFTYRYGEKEIFERGEHSEKATKILVIFPNDYEMPLDLSDLHNNEKYEITFEGLKEHSPFAPKGVLSAPLTILKIGEMKLSKEDFETLKKAF